MTKKPKSPTQVLHFKNKTDYQKWNAYRAIHIGIHKHRKASKYPKVVVGGKIHKVQH